MNTGEMLLTLGAMTLLTLLVLNMNSSINSADDYLNKTRFGLERLALATSLIEEISQYPFDETSWDSSKVEKEVSDFTLPSALGPDAGESEVNLFDDVDDFDGYVRFDTTMQNIYKLQCAVNYVTEYAPGTAVSTRTFFKRINITVVDLTENDTTAINYIHGFWYFN